MQARILSICVFAFACGSSSPSTPVPLNVAFGGIWTGTNTLTLAGIGAVAYAPASINVSVNGSSGLVSNCSGQGTFTGSGNAMSSSTTVTCPSESLATSSGWSCGSVVVTFAAGTATLSSGVLSVVMTGNAAGCGESYGALQSFVGVTGVEAGPPPADAGPTEFAGVWYTYASGWDVNGAAAGWAGTSWNPYQGTVITATLDAGVTTFSQTDASKQVWQNSLELTAVDGTSGIVLTPNFQFNLGDSFVLGGGFGTNCTLLTQDWLWDPAVQTTIPTVCGSQVWFVLSGSGSLLVLDAGTGCTAAVGSLTPAQLSWFLSSGTTPCGATWLQTWATSGEEPYDYGPWYLEQVTLAVEWSQGTPQGEGAMPQSPGGPIGLATLGYDNVLAVQGVSIQMNPSSLVSATADGLGSDNPNWGGNIAATPPPAASNVQCGPQVTFVPESISAITRAVEPGFYGGLSFTRQGSVTGCMLCNPSCSAQGFAATENWAYGGLPSP